LFCQLYGRKRLLLVPPLALDMYEAAESLYSGLDPEVQGALPSSAPHWQVTLEPGEALFIPVGYWHHVRALEVSISLALNGFNRPTTSIGSGQAR
jgi:ribosomal protein L16 Arg81 hydroxylase